MIVVAPLQADDAKEGAHLAAAFMINGFQGAGRFVVGNEGAIVQQSLHHRAGIPEEGFAQTLLHLWENFLDAFLGDLGVDGAQEGFGFAIPFGEAFLLEFFFDSINSAGKLFWLRAARLALPVSIARARVR